MKIKNKDKKIKTIKIILTILLLSLIIMTITFRFSSATVNSEMFNSYFESLELIIMNILPIFVFISIIYVISNKMWLGFLSASTLFTLASLVNKFKLIYRDDPFKFIDVKLFSESIAMTRRYEIKFTMDIVLIIIGLIIITFLLKKFFKIKIDSNKDRIVLTSVILLITILCFENIYFDEDRYSRLGDDTLINKWADQQQFQSKGFVYPFFHSILDTKDRALDGYSEEKAKADLNKYTYSDIPEDKKVNVIGIMLEAYNDFSKYDSVEIDEEVYEDFHKLQENSVHGELVTNVFAGGTVNTERGFLTGLQDHPLYGKNTNSFAWYFKEQGYSTKAMHPIYGWFYNRRNVNDLLGFDSFDYYENKYIKEQEEFFDDYEFYDYIIEDYEKSRDKGQPYFNFTVTYQNHGPYSDEKSTDKEYLKRKPEYNESDYNIINNYLDGISEASAAMKKLTDYFEKEEEPVIVVFFGDHNPWLGEDNSGYEMMDINMDFSTKEGFLNYYKTPYIIWGNKQAKTTLGKDFKEESEDLSPNFLMSKLFEYIGFEGNEYMKYLTDLKKDIDVNHGVFFKEDGKYTKKLKPENKDKYNDFRNLQYYYGRNFNKDKANE